MHIKNDQNDRYVEVQVFRFKGDGDLMPLAKFESINSILITKEIYQEGFVVVQNKGDSMEKLIMDGVLLRPYNRNYPVSTIEWDESDLDIV